MGVLVQDRSLFCCHNRIEIFILQHWIIKQAQVYSVFSRPLCQAYFYKLDIAILDDKIFENKNKKFDIKNSSI